MQIITMLNAGFFLSFVNIPVFTLHFSVMDYRIQDLEPEKLDAFADEQLRQLLELKIESERVARGEVATDSVNSADTTETDSKKKII